MKMFPSPATLRFGAIAFGQQGDMWLRLRHFAQPQPNSWTSDTSRTLSEMLWDKI